MSEFFRRTWAEVSLDAIDYNFKVIRDQVKTGTMICCVIKADAYGHGAETLAREYEKLGADWVAVSNLEEAMQIRNAGVKLPILILGYTPPCMAAQLSELNISQTVLSAGYGESLSQEAQKAGVTVKVHIKVDTGMSRIGFMYQDPVRDAGEIDDMERVCRLPALDAEGIFTHFAVADEGEDGRDFTMTQYGNLMKAVELLRKRGITFRIRHCANSAAIFDYPETQLDMVRPGVVLYGLKPSGKIQHVMNLIPAMELKSIVSLVKTVEAKTSVSYGREFTTTAPTKIATVPIGYADGYVRHLYVQGSMLVRGRKAKIIGRVCMDQLMLDVTSVPDVKEGDVVTVFGRDGDACITLDELASYNQTINYELACMISKRVPRIYYKGGKEVGELNYICK
ncbi:alanine racemase [Caproiciproducens galactitolivorans]|uniref:Alanine racemase n=1 Tax=Caproiciproducens galactitolivorans TaxID=642589 RepID=A0A4Z0YE32_9FIRM|nr:alanine racemase [Caproiciproducens galactitolivorans]QEY35738.1 alanine racemase [Caproiciproducens galactitolivorans]TGJ77471.1 alanine racemase [Caproiciproducens galactitolivorans]